MVHPATATPLNILLSYLSFYITVGGGGGGGVGVDEACINSSVAQWFLS